MILLLLIFFFLYAAGLFSPSHIGSLKICFFIYKNEEWELVKASIAILVSNTGSQTAAPLSGNSEREFCLQRRTLGFPEAVQGALRCTFSESESKETLLWVLTSH